MKFFITFILVIATASARVSGPYLPSGWRPKGPAFLLPSEIISSVSPAVQDLQFPEAEASGSDAFREYGPPKIEEVTLSVNQALPEVATEQAFFVKSEAVVEDDRNIVDVKVNEESVPVESVSANLESVETNEELTTETSAVKRIDEAQAVTKVIQTEEIDCETITDTGITSTTIGVDDVVSSKSVEERQPLDLLQNVNETFDTIKENGADFTVSAIENIVVPTEEITVQELRNSEQSQSVSETAQSDEIQELTSAQEDEKDTIVNDIVNTEVAVNPTTVIETQTIAELQEISEIVQSKDIKEDAVEPTAVIEEQALQVLEQLKETNKISKTEDLIEQDLEIAPTATILEDSVVISPIIEDQTLKVIEQVKETIESVHTEDIKEQDLKIAPTAKILEENVVTTAIPEDKTEVLKQITESVEEEKELGTTVVPTTVAEENTITTISNADEQEKETSKAIKPEEIKKQEEFIVVVEDNVVPAEIEEIVVPLFQQELVQNDVSYTKSEANEGVTEGIHNILKAIINTEEEAKTENKAAISTSTAEKQEILESFPEYNPAGFAVYGPPQQEDLIIAKVANPDDLKTNEVRRRRFSPKLRLSRKH